MHRANRQEDEKGRKKKMWSESVRRRSLRFMWNEWRRIRDMIDQKEQWMAKNAVSVHKQNDQLESTEKVRVWYREGWAEMHKKYSKILIYKPAYFLFRIYWRATGWFFLNQNSLVSKTAQWVKHLELSNHVCFQPTSINSYFESLTLSPFWISLVILSVILYLKKKSS